MSINNGDVIRGMCVIDKLHNHKLPNQKGVYLCYCVDCHALHELTSYKLSKTAKGKVKCECGLHDKSHTHGLRKHKLYDTFSHMKSRCYNIHDKRYKQYGGRGIVICDKWLKDFKAFYDWAINNGYNSNLTIDRIDVNKNYSPDNCRWVDMKTQQRNRTNNILYNINGDSKCLSEWCEIYNVNYFSVRSRLKYGWDIETALTTPFRKKNEVTK